jgi:hypothetical protein
MTVPEALATLTRLGVWMIHDTRYPSVSHAVVGGPVSGSWWGHPEGKRIHAIGEALLDHPDTLSVKLLDGKDTLVHRRLWPAVLGVATSRAPWQVSGIDAAATETLAKVEAAGPLQGAGPVFATLARRLLVHAGRVHTPSGKHVTELESWSAWARREGVAAEGPEALEAAVEAACPGAGARLPGRRPRAAC